MNDTFNKTWDEGTQTVIARQKRELIDTDSGEILHVDQITKIAYGTKQFWKVYLMDFLGILGIIDSKQLEIFIFIIENTDQANNLFIGTYKQIAKEVNCSSATITKIFKKLQKHEFIKMKQRGVWIVNPNILMKGNDHKRQILLNYFCAEEENKTTSDKVVIDVKRGKSKKLVPNEIPGQINALEDNDKEDNDNEER